MKINGEIHAKAKNRGENIWQQKEVVYGSIVIEEFSKSIGESLALRLVSDFIEPFI